jgi:hypothetical protein
MSVALGEPVDVLAGCLDSAREMLPSLDDEGIVRALRDMEKHLRQTQSVMLEVVAQVESRRLAAREGFGTTARLLAGMVQLSAAEARSRVEHAALVGSRRTLTGETLAPAAPVAAAALAAGEIGTGQLRVISEMIGSLPASVPEAARAQAEATLAGYAGDVDPRRLRLIADRLRAALDPDGPEPSDEAPATPARGELWLRNRRDGRLALEGWLDAEQGSQVRALIEQLAARRPTTPDGLTDPRTLPQRQADALIELCDRARTAEGFPTTGGEPPHVTVTIDWEALRTGLGTGMLGYGQRLSAGDARRMACDCKIIPVVLGGDSEPLDVGRAQRTVPMGIRRALVARDGGCAFPGCDRPPGLCEAHHAQHWIDGGVTAVHNCCLLCPAHHQQIHRQGWDITIHGGRVEFHPPPIIDPDRRPLNNPLRH